MTTNPSLQKTARTFDKPVDKPVDRASMATRVADVLRNVIISGELGMGAPLNEKELCDNFGVSRTPLRQALFELHGQGLVDLYPYRGASVFSMNGASIRELGEFREILEVAALRGLMLSNRKQAIRELESIVKQMKATVAKDGVDFPRLDTEFHEVFVSYCGNSHIVSAYTAVGLRLAVMRNIVRRASTSLEKSLSEHERILSRIASEDTEAAAAELAEHLRCGTDLFVEKIERINDLLPD